MNNIVFNICNLTLISLPHIFFQYLVLLGLISLFWNFYNLYQTQKGFPKLKLECKNESYGNEKYILSKTSVKPDCHAVIDAIFP